MGCGTRVIWDPVPKGSTFKLKATGDEHLFNVFASVSLAGETQKPLRHGDIVPGPAELVISGKKRWVIKPTLFLSADPEEPVVMTAWLENQGKIVQLKDDDGSLFDAKCEWKLDDDAMPLRVKISVRSK